MKTFGVTHKKQKKNRQNCLDMKYDGRCTENILRRLHLLVSWASVIHAEACHSLWCKNSDQFTIDL